MLDSAPQSLIDNRYRPLNLLGRGGMGEVYLARDEVLHRDVAVKVLAEQYSGDDESVERFRREARSAAALSHPNIVSVYDLGETADGAHYIVMEYVPGNTLKERILKEGPLDVRTAAGISYQVAAALGAAHDRGLIHRDVKPQNILFTASGGAKVGDFGIARAVDSQLTGTGFALGTAAYMAPEQAMGDHVGPESDLYSLGVVLYQMLTGERPFEADSPLATVVKHANEPPPKLRRPEDGAPTFPREMEAVVGMLLAKNPAERYGQASELMADLERVVDRPPLAGPAMPRGAKLDVASPANGAPGSTEVTVVGSTTRKMKSKRRWRRYLVGAVLTAAILLGAAGVLGYPAAGNAGLPRVLSWDRPVDGGAQAALPKVPGEGKPEGDEGYAAADTKGGSSDRASGSAFVHRATPENVSFNSTYIDDPRTNYNPDAVLSVTQNWNPGGEGGTYNDHPVGVWYDEKTGKWAIFNQDRAAMPEGTAFNVTISSGAPKTD